MAKDGRRIKSLDPINYIIPFIMPNRIGSSNMFESTLDISEAEKYLRQQRLAGRENLSFMHVFMAAYVRVVSQMPGINRFIRGQRIYARNNVEMSLAIKKKMTLDAQETVIQVVTDPADTLSGVYEKINKLVLENKGDGDQNNVDFLARVLNFTPRILLKFFIAILRFLDYFGLMPGTIMKISPFHGSMFITNMGSLGIDAIYHHLYDFGNIPVFVSLGKKKTINVLDENGKIIKKRTIGINVVADERICDGHYYAEAFKKIRRYIEQPWLLEVPPEKIVEDVK